MDIMEKEKRNKMKDMHNHILFSIDDGSKDIETSIAMLRNAQESGIDEMILTPHYISNSKYNANNKKKLELLKILKERCAEENINIKLHLGNEVWADEGLPELIKNGEISTMNNSRYVLIEFPLHNEDMRAQQIIFELISHNYVPIIAHPERYDYLKKDPDKVYDYIRLGALLQGNYLSLFGKYGSQAKKTLKYYIKKGYITFFGSDIHRSVDDFKCEKFKKKLYRLVKKDQKLFEDLTEGNITKIINNEEIDRRN
jgi:protein-tyrosine phosphatase